MVYPGLLIDDYPEFADTRKKGTPLTLHLNLLENVLNPIRPGRGNSFLPAANLNLNYFWTTCDMNLKLYDFSELLLEIMLLKRVEKIKFSGGYILTNK